MIDFSGYTEGLEEVIQAFDACSKLTFGMVFDEPEDFDILDRPIDQTTLGNPKLALAGLITLIRDKISTTICYMTIELQESGMSEAEADRMFEKITDEFDVDSQHVCSMVVDLVELKETKLVIAIIGKYRDIALKLVNYCKTGNKKHLKGPFKKILDSDF